MLPVSTKKIDVPHTRMVIQKEQSKENDELAEDVRQEVLLPLHNQVRVLAKREVDTIMMRKVNELEMIHADGSPVTSVREVGQWWKEPFAPKKAEELYKVSYEAMDIEEGGGSRAARNFERRFMEDMELVYDDKNHETNSLPTKMGTRTGTTGGCIQHLASDVIQSERKMAQPSGTKSSGQHEFRVCSHLPRECGLKNPYKNFRHGYNVLYKGQPLCVQWDDPVVAAAYTGHKEAGVTKFVAAGPATDPKDPIPWRVELIEKYKRMRLEIEKRQKEIKALTKKSKREEQEHAKALGQFVDEIKAGGSSEGGGTSVEDLKKLHREAKKKANANEKQKVRLLGVCCLCFLCGCCNNKFVVAFHCV